jgi:hypothetical protein
MQNVPSKKSSAKDLSETSSPIDLRKVSIKPLQRRHNDIYMRGLRRPRA